MKLQAAATWVAKIIVGAASSHWWRCERCHWFCYYNYVDCIKLGILCYACYLNLCYLDLHYTKKYSSTIAKKVFFFATTVLWFCVIGRFSEVIDEMGFASIDFFIRDIWQGFRQNSPAITRFNSFSSFLFKSNFFCYNEAKVENCLLQ
jgi:hypothetical protein